MQLQTTEHDESGDYKPTCNNCHRSYIGQANHSLRLRFQEHTKYIKSNQRQSAYALHILNCKHNFCTFGGTMILLKHMKKITSPNIRTAVHTIIPT